MHHFFPNKIPAIQRLIVDKLKGVARERIECEPGIVANSYGVGSASRLKFREQMPEIWDKAFKCATDDPSIVIENFVPVEVGEDSGFCDRAKLAGFQIFVNTNIACGHVDQKVLTWIDHRKAMQEAEKWQRLASGLLS